MAKISASKILSSKLFSRYNYSLVAPPIIGNTEMSTAKKKLKYYVVWDGRKTGIFTTWAECESQVKGFLGAKYKSFDSLTNAKRAFQNNYEEYLRQRPTKFILMEVDSRNGPKIPSFCVDASCSGNPGILEYRCVSTETGKEIFAEGPFEQGTNNIGEFLAIVHALALFKNKGISLPIYTDSRNAMGWIQARKCKSKLLRTEKNARLFDIIKRAENWLKKNNTYQNEVLKWKTKMWGENPADYKRK